MAAIDRLKKSFKRLMTRCKSFDATFIRDGQADLTLPVMQIKESDLSVTGELKNLLKLSFYAIDDDDDLVGVSELLHGDAIKRSAGNQYKWTGEILHENDVSITAAFVLYDMPFTGTGGV